MPVFVHGESPSYLHPATPEYRAWAEMIRRCEDPKCNRFYTHGGRGITVAKEWHSYPVFLADVGRRPSPKHQLDRQNNDGNYEPGNVRWATRKQQARNKRNNHLITFKGKTACMAEWAEKLGISRQSLRKRMISGWDLERILTTPKKTKGKTCLSM